MTLQQATEILRADDVFKCYDNCDKNCAECKISERAEALDFVLTFVEISLEMVKRERKLKGENK